MKEARRAVNAQHGQVPVTRYIYLTSQYRRLTVPDPELRSSTAMRRTPTCGKRNPTQCATAEKRWHPRSNP